MSLDEFLEAGFFGKIASEFEEPTNFVELPSAVESSRVRLEGYPFLEGKRVGKVHGQTHGCVVRNASATAELAGELHGWMLLEWKKMLVHVAGVAVGVR